MKEVEVKAKIRDKEILLAELNKLGCKLSDVIIQKDDIFVPSHIERLPTEQGVPVLRIRNSNGKYIFTLKIRLSNGLDKLERETEITDPAALEDIILSINFKKIASVIKQRAKCKYKNFEICVDQVQGLGSFIEVEELSEDGDSAQIQTKLFEFLKSLGVKEEDRVHHGYDVLAFLKDKA